MRLMNRKNMQPFSDPITYASCIAWFPAKHALVVNFSHFTCFFVNFNHIPHFFSPITLELLNPE